MGIIIIAIYSDFYLNLAINLAKSIRKYHKSLAITIITDKDVKGFDTIKPQMQHYMEKGAVNPFRLKTFIYDYSPYDTTLYLDADNLCLKPLDGLFKKVEGVEFQLHEVKRWGKENRHKCKMVWLDKMGVPLGDFQEKYGCADAVYPEYNSSFIFFKKSPKNKEYFDLVKIAYMDRKTDFRPIGKYYPDELAYGISSAALGHYSSIEHFKPIYHKWEDNKKGGGVNLTRIKENYWFLGMAGGYHTSGLTGIYQRLTKTRFNSRKKIFHEKG